MTAEEIEIVAGKLELRSPTPDQVLRARSVRFFF